MTDTHRLIPFLTPHGRLLIGSAEDAPEMEGALARRIEQAFAGGSGHGLLRLGGAEVGRILPPVFAFWREFGSRYITALCTRPGLEERRARIPPPSEGDLDALAAAAPVMPGAEYLTAEVLCALWDEIDSAFSSELADSGVTVQGFLKGLNPAWNVVGRVHFNLAENRGDDRAPFAFLATYTARLSAHGAAQHLPLGQALREYAGAARKERLLSLLLPVQRAAERCAWLKRMVDAGEIFHPLRWSPQEAFRFLGDVPELERAGVVIRMPAAWKAGRPPRPQVTATVGGKAPSGLGGDALLDFRMEVTLDGERLTPAEVTEILAGASGLALIRGRWVEVDRERLGRMMDRFQETARLAARGGLAFAEAMRMLAGADICRDGSAERADPDWSRVVAGPWLAETLRGLRTPEGLAHLDSGHALRGTLRPYQQVGVRWLHLLSRLGLGACLADDMGLGKTIQVLALLLVRRGGASVTRRPSLLVAPASVLANWAAEIERFAPSLTAMVAHPSAMPADQVKSLAPEKLAAADLVITTYGSLLRIPWLATTAWNLVVLDEAQAIKNPGAKQTRAVLRFAGGVATLTDPVAFRQFLATLRASDWVVYAKPPFAGPTQVLEYLGRCTHRVAISNIRLVSLEAGQVRFRWKGYAHGHRVKTMTLSADEFLRRFLLHVLPAGFVRIRHFGFLANRGRTAKLARCRELLAVPPPAPTAPEPVATLMLRVTGVDITRCQVRHAGHLRFLAVFRPGPLPAPVLDTS